MAAQRDPHQEPSNSTVDDWLGQRVSRDEERADEALRSTGGDVQAAEEQFERSSHEAEEYHRQHEQSGGPAERS